MQDTTICRLLAETLALNSRFEDATRWENELPFFFVSKQVSLVSRTSLCNPQASDPINQIKFEGSNTLGCKIDFPACVACLEYKHWFDGPARSVPSF